MPNPWVPRLLHILLCVRQVTQLIRIFESFFKCLGYNRLREVASRIQLSDDIDFIPNALLETDEVMYFTALYDFLLPEHANKLAQDRKSVV